MVNVSYRHNKTFGVLKVKIKADTLDIGIGLQRMLSSVGDAYSMSKYGNTEKQVDIDIVDISYMPNDSETIFAIVHYAIL